MEAAEAEALLGALLLPQNDGIKAAEQRLKAVSSSPSYTILLIDRAMSSPSPQIRQLAAVLARRKCIRHWDMMGEEDRAKVRTMLERMLAQEPEHLVRRSVAELVSSIAKLAVPAGQWTGLLQFLLEASESERSEHREVALLVFSSLTDTIGSQLRPHFQQLVRIFLRGMSDAAASVRMAALAAAGNLIQWLESAQEKAMGAEMVPSVLQVTQHCIEVGEEETALQAIEMLTETIDSNFELLEGHLATLVKFMLDVSCAKGRVELAVREKAMMLVTELCGQKAKLLKKKHMIPMILQATFTLASEGGEDEDEDEDEEPVFKFGTVALDVLSQQLSSRVIVPQVMTHVMANVASPDKYRRRGALYILGVCAEGCSESYVEQLETILPWLLRGLEDEEKAVKEHACWALVQCAEFCQPEIMEDYEQVLPGIFRALQGEAAPNVRRGAMFALDAFCENLGEELEPYLEELMHKMLELLQGDSLEIRELAISAIASAAGSAGEKFVPYYQPVMQHVLQLMHLGEEEAMSLRARATECGAVMAVTVGKERFAGDCAVFVQLAMAGLQLESNELREYTYGAFANLAGLLQEEMLPLLPSLLPKMIESIESEDGVTEVEGDGAPSMRGIVSPDSDDEDESDPKALAVRTAWLDEKSSAVHAVGAIAEGLKAAFEPYLERTLTSVSSLEGYFHEDVRQNVQTCLQKLLLVSFYAHTEPMRRESGAMWDQILHPNTAVMLDSVMELYTRTMKDDDDKETVAQACEAIGALLPIVGGHCMRKFLHRTMEMVQLLFQEKAACQKGGEEEEEDDDDHDQVLIDAVADLLGVIASVYGQEFSGYFDGIFPSLQKYLKPSRQASDRLMAIGAIAEVCSHLKSAALPYIQPMLPILASGLQDQNSGVRRNSVFCCGVFCQSAPDHMSPYMMQILSGIQPLLKEDEEEEVRDNAVGAIARIIMANPTAVPTAQLVGVLVENLPLHGDAAENEVVARCILAVYRLSPEALHPFLGKSVAAFVVLLAEEANAKNLKEETKVEMMSYVSHLHKEYAEPMREVFASFPPQHQQWLSQHLS